MSPQQSFIEEYQFSRLVTWGYSAANFVLVTGDILHQNKLFFKTNLVFLISYALYPMSRLKSMYKLSCSVCHHHDQGSEMNTIMHAYHDAHKAKLARGGV